MFSMYSLIASPQSSCSPVSTRGCSVWRETVDICRVWWELSPQWYVDHSSWGTIGCIWVLCGLIFIFVYQALNVAIYALFYTKKFILEKK